MHKKEKETSSRKRNKWLKWLVSPPALILMLMLMLIGWIYYDNYVIASPIIAYDGLVAMFVIILFASLLLSFIEISPLLLKKYLTKYVKDSQKREKLRKTFVKLRLIDDEGELDNSPHEGDLDIGSALNSSIYSKISYLAWVLCLCFFLAIVARRCG